MTARSLPAKAILLSCLFASHQTIEAQWQKTAGPPGMSVKTFYQRVNALFAGTSANGVYKSTNNGVDWSPSNTGIENKTVFSIIANGRYIFAGTDNGVYRSQNNGASWEPVNRGIEQKFIYTFIFANAYLFAGTSGGMYKSPDRGITWSDANGNALTSSIIHDILFAPPHLVVIADNLVFYSDDNGDSWNYNPNSPFVLGANPCFLSRHDSVLLESRSGVFRSFDGGINWDNFIAVTPDDGNIIGLVQSGNIVYAGTKDGLYSSSNFGKNWQALPVNSIRKGSWFANKFYKSGKNFLLAYEEIGSGYSADTGKTWNYSVQGFPPAASIDDAMVFSNNVLYTGTHGDGVYKSSDAGNTYTKTGNTSNADTLSNSNVTALLKMNKIILAGTCGNGLYRSVNNGLTWKHIKAGLPQQQNTGFLCVRSLAKTRKAVLIGTDQGLYYSLDSGITWKASNLSGKNVTAVTSNDSIACAGIENRTGPSELYRSVNAPATWNVVFQSFDADWASMASDGKSHFYAGTLGTSNYVSNNYGINWQLVGPGIPSGSGGFAIGVLNKNVFIGNANGVYFSNNNGVSFTQSNTGFDGNHAVQGFTFSSTDVYAGLFENSIWKRPLSDFGIAGLKKQEDAEIPVTFIPNPLISESKLNYSIASTQRVIINLYNNNGNLIRQIKNTVQNAGSYSVTLNKAGLHTGNYFLVLITGNKQQAINISVAGD